MIKVMVVDDSPLVRKIASDILSRECGIEVVATASRAEIGLRKMHRAEPDVITMDIEMPGMGGLEAIEEVMRSRPVPVIVMSAFARRGAELTMQALEKGAVDFIAKPAASLSGGIMDIAAELVAKVRQASGIDVKRSQEVKPGLEGAGRGAEGRPEGGIKPGKHTGIRDIVAMGTSTGGPVALKHVLMKLPEDMPVGVVVVQHMPPVFTGAFAARLDMLCGVSVKEAADGDEIAPGRVLIAPGDYHMTVDDSDGLGRVELHRWAPVSGHRPSVDVLMHSVAREYGRRAVGVIMTGMGKDGAEGIGEMKDRGAYIIAQDKRSSVIYGMNKEVIERGDADEAVGLEQIAARVMEQLTEKKEANGFSKNFR